MVGIIVSRFIIIIIIFQSRCARFYGYFLTISSLQTKTDAFANNADPDETAHNEPSHQDLHCLPFCYFYVPRPHPPKVVVGEHIVFGTDPIGVRAGVKLVRSVTWIPFEIFDDTW